MRTTSFIRWASVGLVGILLGLLGVSVIGQLRTSQEESKQADKRTNFILPEGAQIYSIAQAADQWPRLTQAKIDPVDTHLGAEQTLEVIVESLVEIDRVYALIETDNGIKELELLFVEDNPIARINPTLALVPGYEHLAAKEGVISKAKAQDNIIRKLYRNSWIVDDVHDAKYHTTFVAEAGGDSAEVTLAWTDACGIPAGGDWTLSGTKNDCTISAADGVDNGNITINNGNTMTLNADFAWNSGKTITINDGEFVLCASCELKQTNIWQTDQDSDNYPLNSIMALQDQAPTNGRRRNLLQIPLDCDDTDADVYPTQSSFYSTEASGGGYDYNCDSTETKNPTEWLYDWTEDDNGNFCQCNDQLYEPLPAYVSCGDTFNEAECMDGVNLGDPCGHQGPEVNPSGGGQYTVSCN